MSIFEGKRIVLGVTGSVACYKAIDLASKLTQAGALVDVILTESAQKFVKPLVFRSVTGRLAYSDMWDDVLQAREHVPQVKLGESADLLVIAPISAHSIAKLATGLADNLLMVTALAARCPIMIAPAMDGGMYLHPAVQENLAVLEERGVYQVGPDDGRMASGLSGKGRFVETPELMGRIRGVLGRNGLLAGKKVLITAGPTQEPLDPVRYLSNYSTGKQGIAIAQAAVDRGADVTLITGRVYEPIPEGLTHVQIQTAQELHTAVFDYLEATDFLVMTAAVADFRPMEQADQKIKKNKDGKTVPAVSLTRNPDILADVKAWRDQNKHPSLVVGFAAETENLLANGRSKLERKGLDFIAINNVGTETTGFGVDTNAITLIGADDTVTNIPFQSKAGVADAIWRRILRE